MAKLRNTFDLVLDSSHGWLKVPMAELERLNIVDAISTHSYQSVTTWLIWSKTLTWLPS